MGLPYWSLSRYLKLKVKRAVSYVNDFEEALARETRKRGAQGVVCGHIHHAEMRDIGGVLYCNDGDWVESLTALVEHADGRLEILQDLYRRWPFFASVLSNMAQVLAKSDMGLAARYSELVEDIELRARVFDKILAEHDRTIAMLKQITGQDDLLADNPALARSVFNRFPYLEPLNHLQVELLRRYRSGDEDELVQRGILLTMSGLATALRNSG